MSARLRIAGLALATLAGCSNGTSPTYDAAAWPRNYSPLPSAAGPVALVTNSLSDTVSVVDLASSRELAAIPVGLEPVDTDGPHHIVVNPRARTAFVPLSYPPPTLAPGPHGSHGSSLLPGKLVQLSLEDLRVVRSAPTDLNPGDLAITPDGLRVLVTHFDLQRALQTGVSDEMRRATMRVYDAETLQARNVVTVCIAPHGIVVSDDGRRAYLSCYGEDVVAVVSLDDPSYAVERIPIGPGATSSGTPVYGPYSIALSPDQSELWVGDIEGSRATGFGRDMRVFSTANMGAGSRGVALDAAAYFPAFSRDGSTVYVPTQGPDGLVAIDRVTRSIRMRRTFDATAECAKPHQISMGPDGMLYLVCEGQHSLPPFVPGTLLRIDPTSLETRGRTPVGVFPDAVVFPSGATTPSTPDAGAR